MKQIVWFLSVLIFSYSCVQQKKGADQKPVILVSILPQQTFVEKIGGNDFNVKLLIPQGANPVTYSLLPAQMKEISDAEVWFRMGYVGFELSWAEQVIQTNAEMKVVDLSDGLDLITTNTAKTNLKNSGIDPHTWLSPDLVRLMAAKICDELIILKPENAPLYQSNLTAFLKEIDDTDQKIRQLLDQYHGRSFISFHPSLSYFARTYGLEQLSVERGGKEPTSERLAELIETARARKIKAIFIQSDFDKAPAQTFATEIGGEIIQVWPLNPDWSSNMLQMATLLHQNFK